MIIATLVALFALPLLVLRRRTLAAYFAVDAVTWLVAWILWRRLPGFDPHLGGTIVAVLKVATFSLFLARGRDVVWSATRAALLAAIVYAVVIPTTLREADLDGDEQYYLLISDSIVRDTDLDLANQYRLQPLRYERREDITPQPGDPTGANGELYSRHEPFLALLMAPGYALWNVWGALATIALFGALLVRSTIRWMEDEGISEEAARAVFPFFAFAPPVLFYATRAWPEVPAAFFFVEALRGAREHRMKRWLPALFGLVMLKLRFVLVAAGLVATMLFDRRKVLRRRTIVLALATLGTPLLVMWLISGSATNVHSWRELLPGEPHRYALGFFGLLADGMSGIAFRAPFYLLGLFALVRWNGTPRGFRVGMLAGALYILYLLPRMEWFGGWAPPLRYLVFLMPVLALGAASMWDRISREAVALISVWTIALVIHGVRYPWRLFHIANGENPIGEWLSVAYRADFSRLFPSYIRPNAAAWFGAAVVLLLITIGLRRWKFDLAIPLVSLAIAGGFVYARQPASRVEFEDAHVAHDSGVLYPELYQVLRVAYRGGWVLEGGQSISFLARAGTWRLEAITGLGATFELAGRAYHLQPDERYQTLRVTIPESGRVTLRCLSGAVNLDRMVRDE